MTVRGQTFVCFVETYAIGTEIGFWVTIPLRQKLIQESNGNYIGIRILAEVRKAFLVVPRSLGACKLRRGLWPGFHTQYMATLVFASGEYKAEVVAARESAAAAPMAVEVNILRNDDTITKS